MYHRKLIRRINDFDLTLNAVKEHLVVEHSLDDSLLSIYMDAAIEHVEDETRRALSLSEYKIVIPHFSGTAPITVGLSPVRAVSTIHYEDDDVNGTVVDLPTTDYAAKLDSDWLYLVPDSVWPTGCAMTFTVLAGYGDMGTTISDQSAITYTAEYGDMALPNKLKLAVMMLVAHWYTNREATIAMTLNKVPAGVDALLAKYRNYKA